MWTNYLKIAWRNLQADKPYSSINILGLALGIAATILILFYILDELSYDSYHEKADRIYRLEADFLVNGNTFRERTVPAPFGAVLTKDYPKIENYARILGPRKSLVKNPGDTQTFAEANTVFADASIFDIFTLPVLAGNPRVSLREPNTMVISESVAKKYFHSIQVVGKTLHMDNTSDYKIVGVIKDMPTQSHIRFDIIQAMAGNAESKEVNWMSDNFVTYLLTKPNLDIKELNTYLIEATRKYMDGPLKKMTGSSIAELDAHQEYFRYNSMPITDIHLKSTLSDEAEPSGSIQTVHLFMIIAVMILLIACANFTNLSTARASRRSKEVGVRKVLGSTRSKLMVQFLTESILMSFFASLFALILVALLLPSLNQISGKAISLSFLKTYWLLGGLLFFSLLVGSVSGIYPAFFLSAFEPAKTLKSKTASGLKDRGLRSVLVIFQFAAAIILIISTCVILTQLHFIQNVRLGYNRDQVLVIKNGYSLWKQLPIFKEELKKLPGVQSVSIARTLPTDLNRNVHIFSKDPARSSGEVTGIAQWDIDHDYFATLDIELLKGRNFLAHSITDSSAILINESAAKLLAYKDPLHQSLYEGNIKREIIGVVKDFNAGSLHSTVPPLVFSLTDMADNIIVRVNTSNISHLLNQIEEQYHGMEKMDGQPFSYSFLNENFNRLYDAEHRAGKLFFVAAAFAIFIACLGLFGLISYSCQQRTKEIGIRKVLGASVPSIARMISIDFIRLVGLSILVASPIAWWAMNNWLENFAYKIGIQWWMFLLAGGVAIAIALLTVSLQAIKAALANPVDSLRNE
ncbi:ABC transporter permease [Olivibacter sp. XZL3]|uniref:ABC transporter permease n=1 Tax=Olivibacter sp. XZL3 TaxID=1735116 RepID=UPI0010650C7D|nr:ABC transporter permease [Olivibacter sp. XZL3]